MWNKWKNHFSKKFTSAIANYYKWKNNFSEMKEDVGMSLHEKEGEQEDA